MNKKILLSLLLTATMVSCGNEPTQQPTELPSEEPTQPQPTVNPTEQPTPSETPTSEEISTDDYSGDCGGSEAPTTEEPTTEEPFETKYTNVFVVGDSTMCAFNDETYYYPRYGYATQLQNYLIDNANVVNLALSGRSSKSFTEEGNYQELKSQIAEGDYVIIGFGHNDEKADDAARFTDASLPQEDPNSFAYSLYENYIKLALEADATPILATPIVRASSSDNYSGSNAHITENGNYSQVMIDLANKYSLTVIDMTSLTKDLYTNLGYNEACYFHAMTAGKLAEDGVSVIADINSTDNTHLNIYGAKMVAYMFINELLESESTLRHYVKEEINEPNKETDLVANEKYELKTYDGPDFTNYVPADHFTTITPEWYGTAFGDCGGNPTSSGNGYIAKETSEGVFEVGCVNSKGKFASTSDGFAFVFRQVDANKNFTLTAKAKVKQTASTKQAGFGLMLRDDAYLPENNKALIGNYVTAGFLCDSSSMNVLFNRESASKINKSDLNISSLYQVDDEATLTIVRLGQKITVTVVYNGETYTKEYLDYPLQVTDQKYMYIGMFANRGTVVEFSEVNFEITGDAIQA